MVFPKKKKKKKTKLSDDPSAEWSGMASSYSTTFADSLSPLYELIFSKFPEKQRDKLRVLDWGCGSGHLCRHIASHLAGATVLGCDFAPGMIKVAESLAATSKNEGLSFRVARAPEELGEEAEFDVVVLSLVMMYVRTKEERAELLRSLLARMKAGAVLIEAHWSAFDRVGWARVLKQSGRKRLFSEVEKDQDPSCRLHSTASWKAELADHSELIDVLSVEPHTLKLQWQQGVHDILKFGGIEDDKASTAIGLDQAREVTGNKSLNINDPLALDSELILTVLKKR